MSQTDLPSSAECTALSVLHDLQLAHVRQQHGAPKRAVRWPSTGPSVSPRAGDNLTAPVVQPAETDDRGAVAL